MKRQLRESRFSFCGAFRASMPGFRNRRTDPISSEFCISFEAFTLSVCLKHCLTSLPAPMDLLCGLWRRR
jgi:hypothetical protein